MAKILLMLKTHQPVRVAEYSFFDLGKHKNYFNENLNRHIISRIADNCYLPVNRLLQRLTDRNADDFQFSISISGTTIDQLEKHRPDALESFVKLAATGNVEILCEPYYYSLAFYKSPVEFEEQVDLHRQKIEALFGQRPVSFLNTEFCYNNELAKLVSKAGFSHILSEGADWVLHGKTPDQVFHSTSGDCSLHFRNYRLSDDVKFKYSDYSWKSYPLTAEKYCQWIKNSNGEVINLFYDYENFGEHHKKETGILDFLEKTLLKLVKDKGTQFNTINEAGRSSELNVLNVPYTVSRADLEKDLSAWKGNAMQSEAFARLYDLEEKVRASGDINLLHQWRLLQTADHFYYMSTKGLKDGQVHKYFSPFGSPHDGYRYYMNILADFELKTDKVLNLKSAVVRKAS